MGLIPHVYTVPSLKDAKMQRRLLRCITWLVISAVGIMLCTFSPAAGPYENGQVSQPVPAGEQSGGLTITYPLDETLFPPEIVAPQFRWTDITPDVDLWLIEIAFRDGGESMRFESPVDYWTPEDADWESIKQRSLENDAHVTVRGVNSAGPGTVLSESAIDIRTSRDEVGAPIFYREVNLPFIEAVNDPSRIRWRFGPISSKEQPRIVLENLPVCGNCHSFSLDGSVLGMDVDFANDKGSYAITRVEEEIVLDKSKIITWSDYKRGEGEPTFGLLAQVSPDGKYVVCTAKDRSVFMPTPGLEISQLFFPVQGILVCYNRETGEFKALPGADDPDLVQSNPAWSPDGKELIFARNKVHRLGSYDYSKGAGVLLTPEEYEEFFEKGRTFQFDLYRLPFNDGNGGTPVPVEGASNNGMSNYFAKYSPDGKWIVFCKARSFMLLQPDSELYIMPAAGGEPRRMRCNTGRMNSWHTWSPNSKWLAFTSKINGPFTQLWLTHIDEEGRSSPPVVLEHFASPNRAVNIPEFVNTSPAMIARIREEFVDDVSYLRGADVSLQVGDTKTALRSYRKALELNPDNVDVRVNMAIALIRAGNTKQAESHLLEAIRVMPGHAGAHANLGNLRLRQGRFGEAETCLRKALELRPELPDIRNSLGLVLVQLDKLDEAVEQLNKALELRPDYVEAHQNLGLALMVKGDLAEAREQLREAEKLEPDNPTTQDLLARTAAKAGDFRQAVLLGERAVELARDAGSNLLTRDFEQRLRRYRTAVKGIEVKARSE